uniref:7TM_GPCR_Srx domain-containing protein n=1 Tax=Strongyloides venezuelensis TaxID=75913 RepID=A0A0K0G5A6_STRVS
MSLNRYITVGQPIMYERLFQNYLVYIYIFITLVIGGLIGVISSKFDCSYVYSDLLKRLILRFQKMDGVTQKKFAISAKPIYLDRPKQSFI